MSLAGSCKPEQLSISATSILTGLSKLMALSETYRGFPDENTTHLKAPLMSFAAVPIYYGLASCGRGRRPRRCFGALARVRFSLFSYRRANAFLSPNSFI